MAGLKKQNRDGFIHHLCWPKGKTKHLSHKVLYLTSDTPVLCLSFSSSWCEQAIFAQHVALREWHEGTWILAWTGVRNLFLPWHCSNKLSVKFYSHQGKKKEKVQSMWWGMQPQPWVTICFPDWWIAGATWKPNCKRSSIFHVESPDEDCKELIVSPAFDFQFDFLDCSPYLQTGNRLCEVHVSISSCTESMRKHDRKQLQVAWSVWVGGSPMVTSPELDPILTK